MAVNMLDPAFNFATAIEVDSPCHEPYSADHLADPNSTSGFLTASFKKVPVNFVVTFVEPSAVIIQKVIFRPKIFSHCSTGATFNILRPGCSKWVFGTRASWDPDVDWVVFENPHYQSHDIFPRDVCKPFQFPNPVTVRIKTFILPRHLLEVSAICIQVNSVNGGKSAAMKNLKVYGCPSLRIGREEYGKFAQSLRQKGEPKPEEKPVEARKDAPKVEVELSTLPGFRPALGASSSPSTSGKLIVPEEFLDPLTFLLLLDPVILPSGVTVDLSTLRKHENVQAEYGRNLFDPYTGKKLEYSDLRANLTLRQKILEFLYGNKERILDDSTAAERVRLGEFFKTRDEAATSSAEDPTTPEKVAKEPEAKKAEWTRPCRDCLKEAAWSSMYEYPCGFHMCRGCAVQRSFGGTPRGTSTCSFCGRQHSSVDIRRVHAK